MVIVGCPVGVPVGQIYNLSCSLLNCGSVNVALFVDFRIFGNTLELVLIFLDFSGQKKKIINLGA